MVNIVKCKPKAAECESDKKKDKNANDQRQDGGQQAGPEKAQKPPCPAPEVQGKGKKKDAAGKGKEGADGEKKNAPCGPEKQAKGGQKKPPRKNAGPGIKRVDIADQPIISSQVLHPQNYSYGVPKIELGLSALKFPQKTDEEKDSGAQDRQSISTILSRHRELSGALTGMLEKQQQSAIQASQRILQAFNANQNYVLADYHYLDGLLLDNHRSRMQDLAQTGAYLRNKIEGVHIVQRKAVYSIATKGRSAIRKKIDTVQQSIDGTVSNILKPYTDAISEKSDAVKGSVNDTLDGMTNWQTGINKTFPLIGGQDAMDKAANEGKRQTAECKVAEEIDKLKCKAKDVPAAMQALAKPFKEHTRANIEPPMREEAKNAEECGFKAVDAAVDKTMGNLEQASKDGKQAISRSVHATKSRLTEQLNAARKALQEQTSAQLERLKNEAQTADKRVAQAHESQKQGMVDGMQSYRQSVIDAAPDGVSAAKNVATSGAGATRITFKNLRKSHLAQCEQIASGSTDGLSTTHTNYWISSNEAVTTQNAAANNLTDETRTNLHKSTKERSAQMVSLKNGVQGVVDTWAIDMATKYQAQIAAVETQLQSCKEGFDADLKDKKDEVDAWLKPREDPETFFAKDLHEIATKVKTDVEDRVRKLIDEFDDLIVHDDVITNAVRGVTYYQGLALKETYNKTGNSLYADIAEYTSGDDESAIWAYIAGDEARGAEYELQASIGFFNDDEARIKKTMRSLDDENLQKLVNRESAKGVIDDVADSLGGTDLQVFNTLTDEGLPHLQRLSRADAYELEDKISKARTREEVNQQIAAYYSNNPDRGYGDDVSNEELRRSINDQMAVVRGVKDKEGKPVTGQEADKAMQGFVTDKHSQIAKIEQMRCQQGHGGGCYKSEKTQRFEGAQEDRAKALINHGVGSKEDKIALLGIEANRAGGGKMENIDKNLVDARLNPNVLDPNHYQDGVVPESAKKAYQDALVEREQILKGVAEEYGNPDSSKGKSLEEQVSNLLGQGHSKLGKDVVKGLVTETFPSAKTSSMLIEYAAGGYFDGTNEALMKQATNRLDKDQIAAAEASYAARYPGRSLWNLVKSETSGQDFLDMELAWMGQPRNDKEKAERALFAIHQQKRETGGVGKWLMSGSRSESLMKTKEAELRDLVGGSISFSKRGDPPKVTIRNPNFDKRGKFQGDRSDLLSTASAAQGAAENYAKNIDEWADGITTGIAIIGAVVATVVTGGGAAPLLAAAIAGGAGLASMAAKHVIKGGRYGWEEALVDLGNTGVQMLTAGLGQKLQAIAAASKTMGPVQQALLPAVVTGGLDSMGQTVLNEGTWKDGFGKGIEEVLAGTFKGVLTSGVAALGGQALQKIPIGKAADDVVEGAAGSAKKFTTLGDLADSSNLFSRAASQSFQSAGSSFLSTGAGIGFDAMRGKYKGNWEDAFKEMGKSAGQAAFQGVFEGGGEALRDKHKIKFGLYTKPGWMSDAEYQAAKNPSRNPQSGTAAAVDGSRFRGDLHDTPVVNGTHVNQGLKDLTADGGFMQNKVRIDPDSDGSRVFVKLDDGTEVPVKFKTVDEMTLTEKGIPVAEFHPDGNGFVVHVSSKADPGMIQRAMVHEMTEIRHLKRKDANTEDVLRPGGPTQRRPDDQPQLSPHDRARIAELEFINRQVEIAKAKTPPDQARIKQLGDETLFLLAHLGVVNNTEGAKHRRALLDEHLPNDAMRQAIDSSIEATQNDVRFQYRGADHDAALDMLAKQWQHHIDVGDTATAQKILQRIRRRLMRSGDIKTDRRFTDQQKLGENQLLTDNPELVAAMNKLLTDENKIGESALKNDPAAEDPHGAQAVRREFADNPQFQDWQDFKNQFFKTFKGADPADPIHLDHAYYQWSTGAYVNQNTGRLRSVLSDVARPQPDFQHKWQNGKKPSALEKAKLTISQKLDHSLEKLIKSTDSEIVDAIELVGGKKVALSDALTHSIKAITDADPVTSVTVDKAAKLRHELLKEARRLDALLKTPSVLEGDNFKQLKQLHHDLEHQAIKLSETLGEAAAKNVAELEKGNWEPVPLDGQGAGLPDVVYRNKDTGQLLLIEAKGGGSALGTRLSSDGRMRVEQGTRAYLESLAKTMQGSSTESTRKLGDELLAQLGKKDGVDYRLVKQRFDAEGKPQTPDVGRFDIGDPLNAATTHRNAAAVPDSSFHGEKSQLLRNKPQHLQRAVTELIDSAIGIGRQLKPVEGKPNVYEMRLDNGKRVLIELDVVSHKKLALHESGRANAEWKKSDTKAPDGVEGVFKINISDRMDPSQIGRALAHDLREVHQNAMANSDTLAPVTQNEHGLDLNSPHGRARLEEITWLNHKISQADQFSQSHYQDELNKLVMHLSGGNIQRRVQLADVLLSSGDMSADVWLSPGMNGQELVLSGAFGPETVQKYAETLRVSPSEQKKKLGDLIDAPLVEPIVDTLFNEAEKAEGVVTSILTNIADTKGGEMKGFEHRQKTKESLARKIRKDAAEDGIPYAESAVDIKDALRYTIAFPKDDYVSGVEEIRQEFERLGFKEIKFKNSWKGTGYKGINAVYVTPDGVRFELQFHTPKSYWAKEDGTHAIFEEQRKHPAGSDAWEEGQRRQNEVFDTVEEPSGARDLKKS